MKDAIETTAKRPQGPKCSSLVMHIRNRQDRKMPAKHEDYTSTGTTTPPPAKKKRKAVDTKAGSIPVMTFEHYLYLKCMYVM